MTRDYAALHRFIAERARTPFCGFDEWDCCVRFAAGAVAAQTGADPLARLTRRWSTQAGAALALRRIGGLSAGVSSVLTETPLAHARRGDVAGATAPGAPLILMLVEGAMLIGPDANGVRMLPRSAMSIAWSAT